MQQAAELSVASPTIEAALDGRFMSGLKEQRLEAAKYFQTLGLHEPTKQEVRAGLRALPELPKPRAAASCHSWDALSKIYRVQKSSGSQAHRGFKFVLFGVDCKSKLWTVC